MFTANDESVLVSFQSLCEQYPHENVIALWEMAGGQVAAQSKEYEIAKLEIAKLELKDGDILAVKLNGHPRLDEIEYMKSYLKKMLPSGVSVLVFGSADVELQIVSRPTPLAVDTATPSGNGGA